MRQFDDEQFKEAQQEVGGQFRFLHEDEHAFQIYDALATAMHRNAVIHGWYDLFMQMQERLEDPIMALRLQVKTNALGICEEASKELSNAVEQENLDPEKVLEEATDCVIRSMENHAFILRMFKQMNLVPQDDSLGSHLGRKVMVNIARPYRHGKVV